MFGTIRKHQTWTWFIVIGATIVGMVVFFSPTSQFSNVSVTEYDYGVIDGARVTADEYDKAWREAALRFFLTRQPNSRENFEGEAARSETYQRLFVIRKLKQYGIDVDRESVAQAAVEILRRNGVTLEQLLQAIAQKRVGLGPTDFERYIRHELAIDQLVLIVGLNGELVTPQEAQSLYVHLSQELATEAVFFAGSNYLAEVPVPSTDALARFYTNQMSVYRLPDRVQVRYLQFEYSNYLARVQGAYTNVNSDIEANLLKLGTNYVHYGKTPEEAKPKIGEELIRQRTMYEAHREAMRLLNDLFDREVPRPERLAELAATNGLTLKVSQPFDSMNGPTEFDGGPNFAAIAFPLTINEPFAGKVIMSETAAFIIGLDRKLPSEVPPLERIHDRVVADWRYSQAVQRAQLAGESFLRAATNALAQGKSFEALCVEAKVKPVTVPPFSRRTMPHIEADVNSYEYKQNAFSIPVGQVACFNPPHFGSVVLHVAKRLPVDEAKMKMDMPTFLASLRQERRQEFFNAWFQREATRSLREILSPRAPGVPGPG